jgi:hypothetical protein
VRAGAYQSAPAATSSASAHAADHHCVGEPAAEASIRPRLPWPEIVVSSPVTGAVLGFRQAPAESWSWFASLVTGSFTVS